MPETDISSEHNNSNLNFGLLLGAVVAAVAVAACVATCGIVGAAIAVSCIGAAISVVASTFVSNNNLSLNSIMENFKGAVIGAVMSLFDLIKSNKDTRESLVISGNYISDNDKYAKRNFIETAIKRINQLLNKGERNITWIVADAGYSDEDKARIMEYARMNCINLMFISNKDQLADYINEGKTPSGEIYKDREEIKISDTTIFAHGSYAAYPDHNCRLALGFDDHEHSDLDFDIGELRDMNIDKDSFSDDSVTWFGACNIGTIPNESEYDTSFAQEWANETGSETIALADGRTDYQYINCYENGMEEVIWDLEDKYRRNVLDEQFSTDGCENYPVKSADEGSENSQWKI